MTRADRVARAPKTEGGQASLGPTAETLVTGRRLSTERGPYSLVQGSPRTTLQRALVDGLHGSTRVGLQRQRLEATMPEPEPARRPAGVAQRHESDDSAEDDDDPPVAFDADAQAFDREESEPDKPRDEVLVELLEPFIDNKIGSCVRCASEARRALLRMPFGRPFEVGAVLVELETGTMVRNHTALLASWDEGLFVVDTTMGQFGTWPRGVLICPYAQWLSILRDNQPHPVTRCEESFKESGCFTDLELSSSMSRFRGNEKVASGFKDNGQSISTEED